MILTKQSDTGVIKSNTGAESSFSIAMNGKAFRVLSDTIYKDKTGSLVREICCNAYDSHVQAGRADVPFTVHLPDAMEPYFAVTDYGLGLSDESVRSIFTTYFKSTKDNSNDVIGAFGLGSKTPFAYTDTFTITSTYNGETVFYSAYLNDDGVPSISELARQPSAEHNGVEIQVPVNREDFLNFRNAVAEQLRFFTVKPVIKNCSGFEFATVSGTDILSVANLTLNRSYRGIYVIQGQVGYPLARAHSGELAKLSEKARSFLDNIEDVGGTLVVPIGKIEVIASREGISYSKATVASLNEYLELAADQVKDAIAERLSNSTSDWERACVINTNNFFGQFAKTAADLLGNNAFYANYGRINLQINKAISCVANQFEMGGKRPRTNTTSTIVPDFNTLFIYKDTIKAYVKRIHYYFENNPHSGSVYVVNPIGLDSADAISKALGGAKVIAVSDMPEPPKTATVRGARGDYKVPEAYSYNPKTSSVHTTRNWNRLTDFDPADYDNIVVVTVERERVNHGSANHNHLNHIVEQGGAVIGIRAKDYDKFMEQNPNAVSLAGAVSKIDTEMKARFSKRRYSKLILANHAKTFMGATGVATENIRRHLARYDFTGTNIKKFNDAFDRLVKFTNRFKVEMENLSALEQAYFNEKSVQVQLPQIVKERITNFAGDIKNRLSLLQWYSYANGDWNSHVVEYVKHFDKVIDT